MSRMYDDYLDDIGYFDIENDPECVEIVQRHGRQRPLYIFKSGHVATIVDDLDGQRYWPVKLHKGDKHGHLTVRYTDLDGKKREEYVHRVVAQNFIRNDDPSKRPNVLHWDDNPSNNRVENLRWGNQHMNWDDSVRNGTAYYITDEDRLSGLKGLMRPVIARNIESGEELYFESINDAARDLGVQQANVCKVLRGDRKQTGGWYFERADN